jgi:glutathione S-transferase
MAGVVPVLWGRANSINVQKVLWCAAELGLEVERRDAGGPFGWPEGYAAMNPTGRVPTLVDDRLTLWESNTIVRYLAARHDPGGLWPREPVERALAERWMDLQLDRFAPPMRTLHQGLVRTAPAHRDAAAIESAHAEVAALWPIVDAQLARTAWLAGDRFTLGDVPLGAYARRWYALAIDRPRLPHLEAWLERLHGRPGFAAHVVQPLS